MDSQVGRGGEGGRERERETGRGREREIESFRRRGREREREREREMERELKHAVLSETHTQCGVEESGLVMCNSRLPHLSLCSHLCRAPEIIEQRVLRCLWLD